jgi:D-3-phosphoglycerate dehydrogenase
MTPFKVALVALNGQVVPDWVREQFTSANINFVAEECKSRDTLAQVAGDADVVWVLGDHDVLYPENLDAIPRCGAIIRTGSGTDNIPVREVTKRGIIVANTPEAISDAVATHTIALLMAVIRQIVVQDRFVRNGIWDRDRAWPNWHLQGRTLGLVGFGHIARLVARRMAGFEMNIIVHDPFVSTESIIANGAQPVSFNDLLTQSDFISLHCPLLDSTYHLINEAALHRMKSHAILINTSRGPVIDENALICALQEGWIAAAGLDVTEVEPIAPDSPLLLLNNVIITPHIAGYSDDFWDNFWRYSVETAIDLSEGRWPRSYVNHDVKSRWNLQRN